MVTPDGVNFSVFSKRATAIELLLFDDARAAEPSRVVTLQPREHRTYHYWHVLVPDLQPGQVYAYRAHGPFAPERSLAVAMKSVVAAPEAYDWEGDTPPRTPFARTFIKEGAGPTRHHRVGPGPSVEPRRPVGRSEEPRAQAIDASSSPWT